MYVICLFLISCSNDTNVYYDRETIKKLCLNYDYVSNLPPPPGPELFIRSEDKICKTNITILSRIYKENYKEKQDFEDFVYNVVNQKQVITDNQDYMECFIPDNNISEKYQNLPLNTFMDLYCTKDEKGEYYMLKNIENIITLNTVSYYLFLNKFQVSFDDYIGIYKVYKF